MTTVGQLLHGARERLDGSETPFLDSLVLLEWVTGVTRETILAEQPAPADDLIAKDQLARFLNAVKERGSGRPVAYIIGEKEFFGRPFSVGSGVLIPRPDSEILVTRSLELLQTISPRHDDPLHIHDCCTGSGCIGLSIALEYIELRSAPLILTLSDVDDTALAWARRNVDRLVHSSRLTVNLHRFDLLAVDAAPDGGAGPGLPAADLITANPPYLTTEETVDVLNRGWSEPSLALDAGETGVEALERLVPQAFSHLRPGGYLIVEHGATQAERIAHRMDRAGFQSVPVGRTWPDETDARRDAHRSN